MRVIRHGVSSLSNVRLLLEWHERAMDHAHALHAANCFILIFLLINKLIFFDPRHHAS
jgi:hypothetical protein